MSDVSATALLLQASSFYQPKDGYSLEFGRREARTKTGVRPNPSYRSCLKPETCHPCPLAKRLLIPPDLTAYRNILLFGEGPGRDEREQMKPFTGMSGTLLRSVAEDTKATDWGLGYSNVLLCEGSGALEKPDLARALDCCYARLLEEIAITKPKLLVAAGNLPKSVLNPGERKGITSLAGEQSITNINGKNYPILYLLHPAYVARDIRVFEFFWDQMLEARLFFSEINPEDSKIVKPGNAAAIAILSQYPEITVDTETTSFTPYDLGKTYARGKWFDLGDILCIGLSGDGKTAFVWNKAAFLRDHALLKKLLESRGLRGQNGPFDIPFLMKYGIFPKLTADSLLMDYSMDESPSHPLKRMARRHLNYMDWSATIHPYVAKRNTSYAVIPPSLRNKYNGIDAAVTHELCDYLPKKMNPDETRLYRDLLLPASNMFINISRRGMKIDLTYLVHLIKTWQARQLDIAKQLKGFKLKNPNSPKQVAAIIGKMGYDLMGEGTSKDVLVELIAESQQAGDTYATDFFKLLKESREIQKVLWTHLLDVAKSVSWIDGLIHPDFKMYATVTGRLVITHPGLLNFPHTIRLAEELRKIFIPRKGRLWEHRDEKQFELRVYSAMNNDRKMIALFSTPGTDPHHSIGLEAYGPEYPQLNEESFGSLRVIVKTIVFGRVYGRGAESVADTLGVELAEADRICRIVDHRFDTITAYRNWVQREIDTNQCLVNPYGRHRRFPVITSDNYHECLLEGYNFPIQSTANDLNLDGMLALYNHYDCARFGEDAPYWPMIPIHDAIEGEPIESRAQELLEENSSIVSQIPYKIFPDTDLAFVTDCKLGSRWSEAS